MTTETQKYEACATMLKEVLAQYAAIGFAVASEGGDFDDATVHAQARDPRWVAEQTREVLARTFCKVESMDDGRSLT